MGSISIKKITINGTEYTDFSRPLKYDGDSDPTIIGEINPGPLMWGMCIKYLPTSGPMSIAEGFPGPSNPDVQREWTPYTIRQDGQTLVAHDDMTGDTQSVTLNLQRARPLTEIEKKLKGKQIYILFPTGSDPIPNLGVMGAVGLFGSTLPQFQKEHTAGLMIPVKKVAGNYVKDNSRTTLVGNLSLIPPASVGSAVGWSFLFTGTQNGHYIVYVTAGPGVFDSKIIDMVDL
jgi:hypothetical protein